MSDEEEAIGGSDIIVADITILNFNVTYELGYAIGLGKRVLPIRNGALAGDTAEIPQIGIFDTLLHQPYVNSDELIAMLEVAEPGTLYSFLGQSRELRKSEILKLMQDRIVDGGEQQKIFELLLWHGVLGFRRSKDEVSFIYDVNYDPNRLKGMMAKVDGGDPMMVINPAFWSGLELSAPKYSG